jgi:glyoxylase-like metal-dependent hydrolase (beta-lactamase superfamily II)
LREVATRALLTGQCRHPEVMTIRGGSLKPVDFPAVATLILHPVEGTILFDTGYDAAFIGATESFPERLYRWTTPVTIEPGRDAASQCRALGHAPEEVRHLVLSHFHADHIAGTHAFPNAVIHCAREGLFAATRGGRLAATRKGMLRALIPADFASRARFFEVCPAVALPGDCEPFDLAADILGDGSLLAVELPGHCPGHWGLLLNDSRWGRHFLVADAAWSLAAIRRNAPPPALTTALLGDTRRARETLHRLHALHRRNSDIRLTPCHCGERAAEIKCG